MSTNISPATLPLRESVIADRTIYISGKIGIDPATGSLPSEGFEAEADQVMKNLGTALRNQGLDYSDLVSVTIYLKSMAQYSTANAIYSNYFKGEFPARVCIAVLDLPLNASIEIAGIAYVSPDRQPKNN